MLFLLCHCFERVSTLLTLNCCNLSVMTSHSLYNYIASEQEVELYSYIFIKKYKCVDSFDSILLNEEKTQSTYPLQFCRDDGMETEGADRG